MFKQVLVAAALLLLAGSARAEDVITTPSQCFAAVDALAQTWENHKYASKAEADKIGAGLASLEEQCKNSKLDEAQKIFVALKVLINR